MAPLLSIITVGTAAEKARAAIEADLQRRERLQAQIERAAQATAALAAAAIARHNFRSAQCPVL